MAVGVYLTEGAARVAALGIGHTIAYTAGTLILSVGLSRRTGHAIVPTALPRAVGLSALIGLIAWGVVSVLDPSGRVACAVLCTVIVVGGGALYLLGVRLTGGRVERRRVEEPEVPDLEPDSAEVDA
jgi:FtsH-binding integral membrane protein